jgi:hypothetical protein
MSHARIRSFCAALPIVLAASYCHGDGGAARQIGQALLEKSVPGFSVTQAIRLNVLLLLAQQQRVPLGIEYLERHALVERISLNVSETSLENLLRMILPADRGYRWSVDEGVVLISNAKISAAASLLDQVISDYELKRPATLQEAALLMKMDLQLELDPSIGGFAGNFAPGDTTRKIGPLHIKSRTVRQILNALVETAGGAAWIVPVPPRQRDKIPAQGLWRILEYHQPPQDFDPVLREIEVSFPIEPATNGQSN